MRQMDVGDEIWFGEQGSKTPQRKSFLAEVKQGITPVTLWPYQEVGHNHEANSDLKALNLGGMFDNPKPVRLVQRMINLVTRPDQGDIVLDFFAGSGTTAHAVLGANMQDNGNRRFVCVQLPHPLARPTHEDGMALNSVADMTAERIRRAAATLRAGNDSCTGDLGFRVFQLDSVQHVVDGRSEEDVLSELLLKCGLDICVPVATRSIAGHKVHAVTDGALIACLARSIANGDVEALAAGIVEWQRELAPGAGTRCVFIDDAFADDVAKVNLNASLQQCGIPNIGSL